MPYVNVEGKHTKLEKYCRTNEYYCVNYHEFLIKNSFVFIYCYADDNYALSFSDNGCIKTTNFWVEGLTFDAIWKMIAPPCNLVITWWNWCNIKCYINGHDIIVSVKKDIRLITLIRAKLNENETAFRQKLLRCRLTDCKIDFF
jgi:hypothetical protein